MEANRLQHKADTYFDGDGDDGDDDGDRAAYDAQYSAEQLRACAATLVDVGKRFEVERTP